MASSNPRLLAPLALGLLAVIALAITVVITGRDEVAQPAVAGDYRAVGPSPCLGSEGTIGIRQSGQFLSLSGPDGVGGKARLDGQSLGGQMRRVAGTIDCADGRTLHLVGRVRGGEHGALSGTLDGHPLTAVRSEDPAPAGTPSAGDKSPAAAPKPLGKSVAAFLLALGVAMVAARLAGTLLTRLGQPRVIGEILAGLVLGPTVLGALAPDLQAHIFPADLLPALGIAANLGLVFFMFLVGLELDVGQMKRTLGRAAAISNVSIVLPMSLGLVIAVPLYSVLAPDTPFLAFALFMGVAMSITAFPVLARVLKERGMLDRPIGALVLACAAFDDVTAWCLIALATAAATSGSAAEAVRTAALAVGCCLVLAFVVRPLLARAQGAYERDGRLSDGWLVAIFAGLLGTAYVTEEIGIAVIFGAFAFGLAMPRHPELRASLTRRLRDFTDLLLLPLFFAYTGLRTDVGLLDRPVLWWITGLLILIAIVGKLVGAAIAARATGYDWRASAVIGALMNTRGLTELIVLNLALEAGVLSDALFASLVLMALVTTAMAGPLLRLLDPDGRYGALDPNSPPLEPAPAVPERAIAV
jgi:Kef-type K+ transport system membrane component KefB